MELTRQLLCPGKLTGCSAFTCNQATDTQLTNTDTALSSHIQKLYLAS